MGLGAQNGRDKWQLLSEPSPNFSLHTPEHLQPCPREFMLSPIFMDAGEIQQIAA
jgi:hypothetical protein